MDPGTQALLSISIPSVTVLVGILIGNARISDLRAQVDDLRRHLDMRLDMMQKYIEARFAESNAELRRVEEVMDARLRHLEDRFK
jgi:hypothetical protein